MNPCMYRVVQTNSVIRDRFVIAMNEAHCQRDICRYTYVPTYIPISEERVIVEKRVTAKKRCDTQHFHLPVSLEIRHCD